MSVLESQPPRFSADEVARIADEIFGVRGTATDLGSERDAQAVAEKARALGFSGAAVGK